MTSWTYLWLLLCDSAILVLRSFGVYRSSLGKLVYLGWHNIGYVRSWLSKLMWTIHLLNNMFTRIRFYPFQHVFMSQVPNRATGLHFPVGSQTGFRWLRTIMDRIGIDPKYKGGSIRMAAASAAIDRGVPIDVVLNTGRWASWQVFDKFYNRSRLQSSAPSIGLTSLA